MHWMVSILCSGYLLTFFLGVAVYSPIHLSVLLVFMAGFLGGNIGISSLWLFFSVVLIFVGGMMVLVLYITCLSENEKSVVGVSRSSFLGLVFLSVWSGTSSGAGSSSQTDSHMATLFSLPSSPVLLFLIVYLVLVLFLSVKVTQSQSGALLKTS